MKGHTLFITLGVLYLYCLLTGATWAAHMWSPEMVHVIQVLDSETQRPVPMVNLTTTWKSGYMTDSNGVVAFYEPMFMGQCSGDGNAQGPAAAKSTVWFSVLADGYKYTEGGIWGGLNIDVHCGGKTLINVERTNIAERLYRISGAGIYRDTIMAGMASQVPGLNAKYILEKGLLARGHMVGQDSVMTTVYRDRMYWFYGDTNRPDNILGNFHATGAVSSMPNPPSLRLDIEYGLNLTYFVDGEFVKSIAPVSPSDQPTWIHDVIALRHDSSGEEQMLATYLKPAVNGHEETRGLLKWNDQKQQFEKLREIDSKIQNVWPVDGGHALIADELYFGQPYPMVKTEATTSGYLQLDKYMSYTPLVPGTSSYNIDNVELERDGSGKLVYAWKENTSPLTPWQMMQLIGKGDMEKDEAYYMQMKSADDGRTVWAHGGTVAWNNYRNCYVMIFVEADGGTSFLGDLWYSESASPHGPWLWAKQIVQHNGQTFYNPKHHYLFDKLEGRIIYFEGTYVNTYTDQIPTPLYDYNQQMYKLDLERVKLPVVVYRNGLTGKHCLRSCGLDNDMEKLAFFAFEDNVIGENVVPVYERDTTMRGSSYIIWSTEPNEDKEPLFYAYRADKQTISRLQSHEPSLLKKIKTIEGDTLFVYNVPKLFRTVVMQ